jgi:uncharacterized protein (DUF302 family)
VGYYVSKVIEGDFATTVERVKAELAASGFGVLSEIDVAATLHKKLNVDFKKYVILVACSPPNALRALQAEDKIGLLLPCNVVVIDQGGGHIEVAAIDPSYTMQALGNSALIPVAETMGGLLRSVIARL